MIIGVKSPEINTLDSHLHGYTPCGCCAWQQWYPLPSAQTNACGEHLVHSWFTSGALLVHSWCTIPVHFRCTPGALSVHFKGFPKGNCFASERKPRSSVQKRVDRFPPNLQTRKGIAPLPKGSLDPPHRNVLDSLFAQLANPKGNCTASERKSRSSAQKRLDRLFANLQTRKRELHRFRKEASILRHRNVWIVFSPNCKPEREISPLPKGSLDPPHRNVWIAQDITTFITARRRNHNQAGQAEDPLRRSQQRGSMNGGLRAHPAQRACCWNLSLA